MPKPATVPSPQTSADRRRVQAALESAGIKAATCARLIGVNSGNLVRWLKKGKGMSAEKLEPVYAWCDQVEAGGWVAPPDKRKLPRRADRECSCTYLDAQPCGAPGCLWPGLIEFDPEAYPETSTPNPLTQRQELCQWCYAWTKPGERCACTKLEKPGREPDPAAFVLETWAAQKLTYTMETAGFRMPEGYRFRVTVERVQQ